MMQMRTGQRACLQMKKSIYGLWIAPKLWFQHLHKALAKLGFKCSSYDQCLLCKDGALLVTFVDDCVLSICDPKDIEWFVTELHKMGFELQVEGDFTPFLVWPLSIAPTGPSTCTKRDSSRSF